MKQATQDAIKVQRVIRSCKTLDQLKVAHKLFQNWKKLHFEEGVFFARGEILEGLLRASYYYRCRELNKPPSKK